MRLLSKIQSAELDRLAIQQGQSFDSLVDSAGRAVVNVIKDEFPECRKFVVLIGPGNNGADGRVIANLLNAPALEVLTEGSVEKLSACLEPGTLVIDAIFGTGLSRELSADLQNLVLKINRSQLSVVAVDVPSGLCADTGRIMGAAIKAKLTVTFTLPKPGFYLNEGPSLCGRIFCKDIGFADPLVKSVANTHFAFGRQAAKMLLPRRGPRSNKAKAGRSIIFAGSKRYPGAGVLAAVAALRSGSGYVELVSFDAAYENVREIPDVLVTKYFDFDWKKIDGSQCAVLVGPGLGVSEQCLHVLKSLQQHQVGSVVLDADALTVLALNKLEVRPLPNWLLTPHAGELARLLGGRASDLEEDRLLSATRASRQFGCLTLFKGFRTVLAEAEKTCIVLSGNPALAKAGTGDVLAGIIVAMMAQGLASKEAALLGAYLHGLVADRWLQRGRDPLSLRATDIVRALPFLLAQIRQS